MASTSVSRAGAPLETKYTVGKSPSVQTRGEQRADQIDVRQQRERDVDQAPVAGGAIDLGRLIDVLRDRHAAGDEDQRPERHPFPDIGDDVRRHRDRMRDQEQRPVLAGDRAPQAVEQAPLR